MYKLVFRNSLALLYYIGDSLKPRRPSQSWVLSHDRQAAPPAVIILIMYKSLAGNSFSFLFLHEPAVPHPLHNREI
jgi:hypothetical protein